tara:strand:+ start:459 stop:1535 length:1077 start_codon:yes stop_codon:yes gene_type:complete
MHVLFGIQGTGNGHLTRARAIGPRLEAKGYKIDYLLSGRERQKYFDMEPFGDFDCRRGFSFVVENGRIQSGQTAKELRPIQFIEDVRNINLKYYNLVISDFEPITAWAAKRQNIPCMSMSHQVAFDYDVPKVSGYHASKAVMRHFAPGTSKVGFHYFHFNQTILPPLIAPQIASPSKHQKIVVYMGFESLHEILSLLEPFRDYEFKVFAHVSDMSVHNHVTINPFSLQRFQKELKDAAGVITNAGFGLSSECLALGKKLLVKPLERQFEQLSNALALQALGRATTMAKLDRNILEQWLELDGHVPIAYPDVAALLCDWITEGEPRDYQELVDSVWDGFEFPFEFDADFGSRLLPDLVV